MKNKLIIIFLSIFFLKSELIADEIDIQSKNILIDKKKEVITFENQVKIKDTENNIIESEEIETFSVVPGSQFSRQLMYICKQGCMKEFEVTSEEEDDVMCPHCGTIGDLL
mgnify:CR=1 FL=1